MKKSIKYLLIILTLLLLTGCSKDNLKFKEDYESLNGKDTNYNTKYRTITIDENNPFIYSDLKQVNKLIEKKKTFIVYFGANWCPWCRSMLPTAIQKAQENNIKKIYYIDVRPDNDDKKEIRDVYDFDKNGKIYLSHKGSNEYHKFLKYADNVLADYNSHGVDVKGTEYEGTKRVGAPNFILIKKGKAVKMEEGISSKQTDPNMELTDEIIKDMEKIFNNLYKEYLK